MISISTTYQRGQYRDMLLTGSREWQRAGRTKKPAVVVGTTAGKDWQFRCYRRTSL